MNLMSFGVFLAVGTLIFVMYAVIFWLIFRKVLLSLGYTRTQFLLFMGTAYIMSMISLFCTLAFSFWVSCIINFIIAVIALIVVVLVALRLRNRSSKN